MDRQHLTRRQLVGRSLAATGSGLLGANLRRPAAARDDATPAADGTPMSGRTISLDLLGGDVWAWEKRLSGTCPGCPPDATISLRVNDAPVPAERTGDAFAALVKLAPGENRVVAVATHADGREETSEPVVHTVRLIPRPTARIAMTVEGDTIVLDGSGSEASEDDGSPIARYAWSVRPDNPAGIPIVAVGVEATPEGGNGEVVAPRITASSPGLDGEYYLSLRVVDQAGREDVATSYFVVEAGQPRVPDPVHENAAWIADAVVYGVITWAFGTEGFRSVTARLDDLRDLGATALWFAPITDTPTGLFGYEVIDYFDVRPEYGTKEDFRELVEEAHARGIRVLMDFVPNHSSIEHPYYRHAAEHGTASPYWDFYDRDEGGNYTYYFEWLHLPNLNYDNPEVWRFMTEAFSSWVREFGVDGFRVDAVWGIKERKPEYLAELLQELNRIKPDSLLIAEASARDPFYAETGFDAAYDWTDELGIWAWADAFGGVGSIGEAITAALTNDGAGYHPDSLVMRFLNNNDTGDRFVTVYGVDFYRVAVAMLLTLPGLPCLYTGDEVGAEFLPYGSIMPIDWTDRYGLRDDVKRLIALRREQPALHSRDWTPLDVEPRVPLFGFLRHAGAADPPVLVLLNFSGEAFEAAVQLPAEFAGFGRGGTLRDLMAQEQVTVAGVDRLAIPVPAWGVRTLIEP